MQKHGFRTPKCIQEGQDHPPELLRTSQTVLFVDLCTFRFDFSSSGGNISGDFGNDFSTKLVVLKQTAPAATNPASGSSCNDLCCALDLFAMLLHNMEGKMD
jgi:hypothetical protein